VWSGRSEGYATDRYVVLWRPRMQLLHQASHRQGPEIACHWDVGVFLHPKATVLYVTGLLLLSLGNNSSENILCLSHWSEKVWALSQHILTTCQHHRSLILVPVTIASSGHFQSFYAFVILILKCPSVQFSWDISVFNNTFSIILSFLLQTSLKSSTAVHWHVDSFTWINEKGVGSDWQRFVYYY